MLKNLKNKKKKGFTLIELVVVIAIIAVLAAVLIPQIAGYINEAKATAVISDCKDVVTAVEAVNAKKTTFTTGAVWGPSTTTGTISNNEDVQKYLGDVTKITKIANDVTYGNMVELIEGTKVWTDAGTKDDIAQNSEIAAP